MCLDGADEHGNGGVEVGYALVGLGEVLVSQVGLPENFELTHKRTSMRRHLPWYVLPRLYVCLRKMYSLTPHRRG